MQNYIVYDNNEVLFSIDTRTPEDVVLDEGQFIVASPYTVEDLYVYSGWLFKKKENPSTLEDNKLTNVPLNSYITVNSTQYGPSNSPTISIEFDQPGTYTIIVESYGYYSKEFIIENPA